MMVVVNKLFFIKKDHYIEKKHSLYKNIINWSFNHVKQPYDGSIFYGQITNKFKWKK